MAKVRSSALGRKIFEEECAEETTGAEQHHSYNIVALRQHLSLFPIPPP